ncbi:hypothetical protein PHLGIDRAFT_129340 [Phlebiopsis gigantea 11061_1 CR5-6]|uniref:Tryptophan synthase beta chain-like PALP domain-containing protein n=1 Tax=Phlebiopsis gigantea (strain 11061_1 CR5-6) TaxID=745531 RepID=A0A0C3S7H4_PHLG1|nr:hypothetical protein PHLGIDRAFT_129340 [Phlebiopsis gigantea 11061_1 CR5-6]
MAHSLYANLPALNYQCPDPIVPTIGPHAFHRTFFSTYASSPLTSLPSLSQELGVKDVLLKYEGDRFGLPAFKILGASWAIGVTLARRLGVDLQGLDAGELNRLLNAEQYRPVLYTATDGNHGRAVAHIARLLGLASRIYVPELVSAASHAAIRSEGAELIRVHGDYGYAVKLCADEAANDAARSLVIQDTAWEGYEEIPNLIIQGYTTIFHEIDAQLAVLGAAPSLIAVPVGVGSLAHAATRHYRTSTAAHPSLLAVEPVSAGCLNATLHAGRSVSVKTGYNIMPGLTCGTVSATALEDLLGGIDLSVLVDDDAVKEAVRDLDKLDVRAEPCGAATLAGVRTLKEVGKLHEDMVVVLVCTEGRLGDESTREAEY